MNQSTEFVLRELFAAAVVPINENHRVMLRATLLQQSRNTIQPKPKHTWASIKLLWLAVPASLALILALTVNPDASPSDTSQANANISNALHIPTALADSIHNTFTSTGIHRVVTTTVRTDEGYGEQYDGTYNSVRTEYIISPNAMLRSMRETYGDLVIDEYRDAFNAQLELFATHPDTATVENCFLSIGTTRTDQSSDELSDNQKFLRNGIDNGDYCGVNTTEQSTGTFYNSAQQIDVQNPEVILDSEHYWDTYIQFTTEQPIKYESIIILSTDSYSYDQDWKDPEDVNQNAIVYAPGDSNLGTEGVISNQLVDGKYLQRIPFNLVTSNSISQGNPVDSYVTASMQLQFALLDQPLSDLWQVAGNNLGDYVRAVYPVLDITLDSDTKTYSVKKIAGEAVINELNTKRKSAVDDQVKKLNDSNEIFKKIAGGSKLLELMNDQQQMDQREENGSVVITATNEYGEGIMHEVETITVYINKETEQLEKIIQRTQYADGANVYTTTFDTIEDLDASDTSKLTREYWSDTAKKIIDEAGASL